MAFLNTNAEFQIKLQIILCNKYLHHFYYNDISELMLWQQLQIRHMFYIKA